MRKPLNAFALQTLFIVIDYEANGNALKTEHQQGSKISDVAFILHKNVALSRPTANKIKMN